ncbi:MAG: hypothetical protein GKR94_34785 [Gammaproteobacteria bacterium]|nr:hypothetical protein [Gammaproteobacteria bacterium]
MDAALYARINPRHDLSKPARRYAYATPVDMAKELLTLRGDTTMGLSPASLISRALHTTSDFSITLGDTVGRVLRDSYLAAPSGIRQLGRQTTARDFRSSRMACMGYCFGGAMSLHAARLGMDLRGVVSFHGSLGSTHTAEPGGIKARILACHGAAYTLVPDEQIDGFKVEMQTTEANYEFIAYEGALHGFTNPGASANGGKYGLPLAYDKATDDQSWADMQRFFGEVMA